LATKTSNIKWMMEVYVVDPQDPVVQDFTLLSGYDNYKVPGKVGVIVPHGFSPSINEYFEKILGKNWLAPGFGPTPSFGIKSVRLNRSKATPDSHCEVSTVGMLPVSVSVGTWVVMSSFDSSVSNDEPMVRFVGQIESINSQYSAGSDGTLTTDSNISLREWSSILMTSFRFDQTSEYFELSKSDNLAGQISASKGIIDLAGKTNSAIAKHFELMATLLSPFDFAHSCLLRIGLMTAAEANSLSLSKENSVSPYTFISIPPSIPKYLMTRLGLSGPYIAPLALPGLGGVALPAFGPLESQPLSQFDSMLSLETALNSPSEADPDFASKFMKVVTGIKPPAEFSSGYWDGIFKIGELDIFASKMNENFKNLRKLKYINSSAGAFLVSGKAAWSVITENIEPAVNEVYTDLWYERTPGNKIRTQPVMVIRDIPFTIKNIAKSDWYQKQYKDQDKMAKIGDEIIEQWTLFDELPRIRIPEESIFNFRVNNTFASSPNYFTVTTNSGVHNAELNTTQGRVDGTLRLRTHQKRFGGMEAIYNIDYYEPEQPGVTSQDIEAAISSPSDAIAAKVKEIEAQTQSTADLSGMHSLYVELQRMWYSYLYLMPNAQIVLKNANLALSVGFNVQFKIGFFQIVGHVSGFSMTSSIDPDGAEVSQTTINLERLVIERLDADNNIVLFPMNLGGWNRLFDEDFAKSELSVVTIDAKG